MTVQKAVEEFDSNQFVTETIALASGSQHIKRRILSTQQAQYLTQHCDSAVPEMLSKLARRSIDGLTPIAYFIVFEQCKDARSLPALADYLEQLTYTDDYQTLQAAKNLPGKPGDDCGGYDYHHAFLYALDAVAAFGIPVPSSSSCSLLDSLKKTAQAVRAKSQSAQHLRGLPADQKE